MCWASEGDGGKWDRQGFGLLKGAWFIIRRFRGDHKNSYLWHRLQRQKILSKKGVWRALASAGSYQRPELSSLLGKWGRVQGPKCVCCFVRYLSCSLRIVSYSQVFWVVLFGIPPPFRKNFQPYSFFLQQIIKSGALTFFGQIKWRQNVLASENGKFVSVLFRQV